jgi:hypothetical protein
MINLYYDNIIFGNGNDKSDDPPVNRTITVTTHFDWCDITYKKCEIKQGFNKNEDLNLYVIEVLYVERLDEIFDNIPKDTIRFINDNKLKLLIYFPTEGFKFSLYDNWFERLHLCFQKYNLINIKKYFLFNNVMTEHLYENFLLSNPRLNNLKFSKVFGYCFFHLEYYKNLQKRWVDEDLRIQETINLNNLYDKQKDFFNLNAKIRAHRLLLNSELERRKLLKYSYTSFLGKGLSDFHENSLDSSVNSLMKIFDVDSQKEKIVNDLIKNYLNEYVKDWKPTYLDSQESKLDIFKIVPEYYEKSFFSVVTETGMDHYLRITEKTFKPLANYHPFLIIGCMGTLDYLRKIGYETFPEMFDESYDEETNVLKRLLMIIDEIENFCLLDTKEKHNRFKKIYDKLIHNHNLFHNVFPERNVKEFKNIFTIIKNDN